MKNISPIVLIDRFMPEMDGLQLCRAIRETESPGYVFIILLTSRESNGDSEEDLSAGADDYLAKPFDKSELKARIETGLRILKLERSLREASDEVRKLTIIDPATGCFSLGYGCGRLAEDIRRAARYEHPLSLVMCGIDRVQNIRDKHGDNAWKAAMLAFANCIQGSVRSKVDWLFRYGRDDFVLVLPETGFEGAKTLAERLNRMVSGLSVSCEGRTFEITASYGVAGFKSDPKLGDIPPDRLMAEADRLLRQASRKGKGRIEAELVQVAY
jgi:two-component system cell cycle response regulator